MFKSSSTIWTSPFVSSFLQRNSSATCSFSRSLLEPFYKSPVQQSDAADFDLGPGKVLAFDGTPNGAGQPVSFVIGKNQSQRIDASIFKIIFSTSRIEPDDNDTQYPQARWDVLYIPFLITCTTRSNPGALGATNSAYSAPRF